MEEKIVLLLPAKLYKPMDLPDKFTVAVYMPAVNYAFYRPELMEDLAKEMPEVEFKFFGNPTQVGKHKSIKNIEYMAYVDDMDGFIKSCSATIRFPFHDGLSISLMEFLLAGRYAATNVPVRHAYHCPKSDLPSIKHALKEIQKTIKKQGINKKASDYWRKKLNHDKYRKTMAKIMGYDPKEYWEKRAEDWNLQAGNMMIEIQDVKDFYKKVNPKSVLDIGCGNGRWIELMEKWGLDLKHYNGMDVSEKLIKICKKKWPDLDFFTAALEEKFSQLYPKVDLIFSYTTLEHVKPENIENVVKQLKKIGKKLLLIEPTGFESRYYCHSHNYKELFNVIEERKLPDKTMYLIDLEK